MRSLVIVIFYFLICSGVVKGQSKGLNLTIGDKAPNLVPFKWLKGESVNDFTKDKIYVIEFGATWCKPCAAAIPELSKIADRYREDVEVVSVFVMENNREPGNNTNPKYVDNVEEYILKRKTEIRYHVAVDGPDKKIENDWLTSGNRVGVPHVFVIDQKGKIAWIGNSVKAIPEVIEKIKSKDYQIEGVMEENKTAEKAAVQFDDNELLLINGNGGDSHDFLFRSLLTRYDGIIRNPYPGYIDGFRWLDDPAFASYKDRLQVVGLPIGKLYYLAYTDTLSNDPRSRNSITYEYPDTIKKPYMKTSYGKYWHEPILEVSDPEPFRWDRKDKKNRYNYSLKVPSGMGSARVLQDFLRRDMEGYFGFNVTVESRVMPYWKLTVVNKARFLEKLKSVEQGGRFDIQEEESTFVIKNGDMRDIIWFLAGSYGYGMYDYGKLPKEDQAAFIDETGIDIDNKIDIAWVKNMSFAEAKSCLMEFGLKLEKSYKTMKVVVIRDPKN